MVREIDTPITSETSSTIRKSVTMIRNSAQITCPYAISPRNTLVPNSVPSTADMRVWTSSKPLIFRLPGEFQNITGTSDTPLTCISRKLFFGGICAARDAGAPAAGALRKPAGDSEKSRKLTSPMLGSRPERNSSLSGAMIATSVLPECTCAQL